MNKKYFLLAMFCIAFFVFVLFFNRISRKIGMLSNGKTIEQRIIDTPDDPFLNYQLGVKNYKKKVFQKARSFFYKASQHVGFDNQVLKMLSHANLANSSFRLAEILIDKKLNTGDTKNKIIELLKESIKNYSLALEFDPANEQVLANKKIASDLLEKLLKDETDQDKKQDSSNQQGGDHGSDDSSSDGEGQEDGKDGSGNNKKNDNFQNPNKSSNQSGNNADDDRTDDGCDREDEQSQDQEDSVRDQSTVENNNHNEQASESNEKIKESNKSATSRHDMNKDLDKQDTAAKEEKGYNDEQQSDVAPTNKDSKQESLTDVAGMFDDKIENEDAISSEQDAKDDVVNNKYRLARMNADAELDRLDQQESALRKRRIIGFTTKGASKSQKGW